MSFDVKNTAPLGGPSLYLRSMRYALLLIVPLFLLSCAQRVLVPVGNGIKADPKTYTALYEDGNVEVVVKANAWKGYPSDLSSYVVPLYVEVVNKSDREVWIDFKDMLLTDEGGNQYNALSPKDAAEIAKRGGRVGVSFGLSYGTPWWGLGWWAPAYTGDEGSDVVKYALIPGRIEPGSRLRGFVYFQPLPDEVEGVTFKLTYWIEGRPVSVKFPYKVVKDGKGSSSNGSKEDRAENSL